MSGVRWEEPPPAKTGHDPNGKRIAWSLIAQQLKDRPGTWAVVHEGGYAPHVPQRVNGGVSWFAPKGAFEAVTRSSGGTTAIYARYVGGSAA